MKFKGLLLIAIIITAILALIYVQGITNEKNPENDEFYFGVSFGGQTAEEAKILIDKVKGYTNFLLINSYDLMTNETALDEVCNYASQANLKFVVYFEFISRIAYPWHQAWLDTAKERWGDKFLGVHLSDEPGGKQIDTANRTITNAVDYSDAANQFVTQINSSNSSLDAKSKGLPLFTSDYALYWWDYLAGYDTVFVELGWNLSSTRQIALCRGAANVQGKDWGAIIVWKYYNPPYLDSGEEIYEDMVLAYRAGAKYVVQFNFAEDMKSAYGILEDEHFEAMQRFWSYFNTYPRLIHGKQTGQVALVLPKDYGWGMRRTEHITQDNIWGLWPEDEKTPLILENINKLITKHGLTFDIVYDDNKFDLSSKYSKLYFWNSTIS